MAEMPKVETVLMPAGGFWGGVGEPPLQPLPRRCAMRYSRRPASDPLVAAEETRFEKCQKAASDSRRPRRAASGGHRMNTNRHCLAVLAVHSVFRRASRRRPGDAPRRRAACSGCHAGEPRGRHAGAAADRTQRRRHRRPRCRNSAAGSGPATVMDRIAKGFTDDEIGPSPPGTPRRRIEEAAMTDMRTSRREFLKHAAAGAAALSRHARDRAGRRRPRRRRRRRLRRRDLRARAQAHRSDASP